MSRTIKAITRYMAASIDSEYPAGGLEQQSMKPRRPTPTVASILTAIATIAISGSAEAGPPVRGFGGGNFAGDGGFAGGSRAVPVSPAGALRAPPAFRSAYFTGRTVGGLSRAPRVDYGRAPMPAVTSRGFTGSGSRSAPPISGRTSPVTSQQNRAISPAKQNARATNSQVAAIDRQRNREDSLAAQNRASDPRTSTAANPHLFVKNHASERHDGNWHRDWDRHRAHLHHNRVFVFIDGFWWGLYPWDFYGAYPNNGYVYPYGDGYSYGGPSTYNYSDDYYDPSSYDDSGYDSNSIVREVQSELANLGYYNGAIDGVQGDATEAGLARYQEDHGLSVTGTVTSATLQAMGLQN